MHVNKSDALIMLQIAVADKGADHISICDYSAPCIIGHVLQQCHVDVNDVDNRYSGESFNRIIDFLNDSYNLTFSKDARYMLSDAQRVTDGSRTWGAALEEAKN